MIDRSPPLVIVGEPGSGKSAILANWVKQRKLYMMHPRRSSEKEFLFFHHAGCSAESMKVKVLLYR